MKHPTDKHSYHQDLNSDLEVWCSTTFSTSWTTESVQDFNIETLYTVWYILQNEEDQSEEMEDLLDNIDNEEVM